MSKGQKFRRVSTGPKWSSDFFLFTNNHFIIKFFNLILFNQKKQQQKSEKWCPTISFICSFFSFFHLIFFSFLNQEYEQHLLLQQHCFKHTRSFINILSTYTNINIKKKTIYSYNPTTTRNFVLGYTKYQTNKQNKKKCQRCLNTTYTTFSHQFQYSDLEYYYLFLQVNCTHSLVPIEIESKKKANKELCSSDFISSWFSLSFFFLS